MPDLEGNSQMGWGLFSKQEKAGVKDEEAASAFERVAALSIFVIRFIEIEENGVFSKAKMIECCFMK